MKDPLKYIAVLDVGTTNIRASLFTSNGILQNRLYSKVQMISEIEGQFEIDPEGIFQDCLCLLKQLFENIDIKDVCLGISTHRNSFLLWNKSSGTPYCNIIVWKDLRAKSLRELWNNSFTVQGIRRLYSLNFFMFSTKRSQMLKDLVFKETHVSLRLYWLLKFSNKLPKDFSQNDCLYGTLDTWIIYRLTEKALHVTDISSASSTGLYDVLSKSWSPVILYLFGIQKNILPKIIQTHGKVLGNVSDVFFGKEIEITALIADQQAASIGCGCFSFNDTKLTLGTGLFLNITTLEKTITRLSPFCAPLIGWKDDSMISNVFEFQGPYLAERLWEFMKTYNISNPSIIDKLGSDSNGDIQFDGIDISIQKNDENVNLRDMARNLLESFAFEFCFLWKKFIKISECEDIRSIKVNGGVSKSDYLLQCISTLCNLTIQRMADVEGTSVGVMLLSRITLGYKTDEFDIYFDKEFLPDQSKKSTPLFQRCKDYGEKIKYSLD